jgi:hypothetical protein
MEFIRLFVTAAVRIIEGFSSESGLWIQTQPGE